MSVFCFYSCFQMVGKGQSVCSQWDRQHLESLWLKKKKTVLLMSCWESWIYLPPFATVQVSPPIALLTDEWESHVQSGSGRSLMQVPAVCSSTHCWLLWVTSPCHCMACVSWQLVFPFLGCHTGKLYNVNTCVCEACFMVPPPSYQNCCWTGFEPRMPTND